MTPEDLARTRAEIDQVLALERDVLEGVPTQLIIGAQVILAKVATWEATLELIQTGPSWLKALAGMATLNALAEATQRRMEDDLLREKTDGSDLA